MNTLEKILYIAEYCDFQTDCVIHIPRTYLNSLSKQEHNKLVSTLKSLIRDGYLIGTGEETVSIPFKYFFAPISIDLINRARSSNPVPRKSSTFTPGVPYIL